MDEKVMLDDRVDVYRRQQKILVAIMAVVIAICIIVVVVVPAVVLTRSSDSGNGDNVDSRGSGPPAVKTASASPSTNGWTIILQRFYDPLSAVWNGMRIGESIPNVLTSSTGDFWMGLPNVYDLLSDDVQTYTLRIDVQLASDGNWYSYTYPTFSIGNSTTQYALYVSDDGSWSPAGNSLLTDGPLTSKIPEYRSNNQPFQTVEPSTTVPNKKFDCARANGGGGWWFSNCYYYCATCNQALCNGCGGFPRWLATRMMIKVNNKL